MNGKLNCTDQRPRRKVNHNRPASVEYLEGRVLLATCDGPLTDGFGDIFGGGGGCPPPPPPVQLPSVQFRTASYAVVENAGRIDITVTRSGPSTGTVQVDFSTQDSTARNGSDYTGVSARRLTFGPGVVSQTVTIPILNDDISEADETVTLLLTNVTGALPGGPNPAVLTISDDDRPSVPTSEFAVSARPLGLVVGDLNGDANVDAVTANYRSHSISVLLGTGRGGFQSAIGFPAGMNPTSLASGDWNTDGKIDLVVTNEGSNSVSVLTGLGNGNLEFSGFLAVGIAPENVVVGDFNGDGKPDLAVINNGIPGNGGTLSVLLGNGMGGFGAATSVPLGTDPVAAAAGDFNSDGKLDVAVTNTGIGFTGVDGNVGVLLGNGDGTFQPMVRYDAGLTPFALLAKDLSGDGVTDLAVANYISNNVSILRGNGNGTFQSAVNLALNANPWSIAASDLNRDGLQDLVVAEAEGGTVSVMLGSGNAAFQAPVYYTVGASPLAVALADFNGDQAPDILASRGIDNGSPGTVVLLLSAAANSPPDTVIDTRPDTLTNSRTAVFSFHGIDDTAVDHMECRLDSGVFSQCVSPANFDVTDGNHTLQVRAVDDGGDVDPSPATWNWTVITETLRIVGAEVQTTGLTITAIQLTASKTLDSATVQNLANYQLLSIAKRGQLKNVPLKGATCDPVECRTVTLAPKKPLKANKTFRIIVSGMPGSPNPRATGLMSSAGVLLDGDGLGGNYVQTIGAGQRISAGDLSLLPPSAPDAAPRSACDSPLATTLAQRSLSHAAAVDVVLADEHATSTSLLDGILSPGAWLDVR